MGHLPPYKWRSLLLTARSPPEPGNVSVSGSSSLDGSRPCFSTHWRAASTRFPLLPLVPSFAAISALLPRTMYGTGRPPGPPDPKGAENVPVAAISDAHFCKLVFVLLWERSWTKITPAYGSNARIKNKKYRWFVLSNLIFFNDFKSLIGNNIGRTISACCSMWCLQ